MPDYKILTCPNCGGTGCPTCQNTGKVRVASDQLQKLKNMVNQTTPSPQSQTFSPSASQPTQRGPNLIQQVTGLDKPHLSTTFTGIITFSFLSILSGAAFASWYFLKTLKPFFAGLITLFTLIGTRFALKQPFFQAHEPNDFLKAIKPPQ